MARLRSTKVAPRTVMTVDDVRAVMAATATIDPAAELALRIAAVAGARRSELASLRWTDENDGQLVIDLAIEVAQRGEGRELRESATKTANVRTVTLDADTVRLIATLRRQREPYGPWMFGLGPEVVSPTASAGGGGRQAGRDRSSLAPS
jgi:integrase